jgi:hypothetical protein
MPIFIIFLLLSLVFAVFSGTLKDKNTNNSLTMFRIIQIICVIISTIGMIAAIGPSRDSGGTEMTAALDKLTGGWSTTIVIGFIYCAALDLVSMGVRALARNLTKSKERREKINVVTPIKKLLLPRIAIILLSGILEIMFIISTIPELITLFRYAIKPDGIHHVQFSGLDNMMIKSSGIQQTGINYSVGLGHVGLVFFIALVLCICFILGLISLIKAIKINKNLQKINGRPYVA